MPNDGLSRRSFLGAGAVATVGLGASVGAQQAAFAQAPADLAAKAQELRQKRERGIRVGMLTAPFGEEPFENVCNFAVEAGIPCMEVVSGPGSRQIDPAKFGPAEADGVKKLLEERGLEISSLCWYENAADTSKTAEFQSHAQKMVDAAKLLGVGTICMITGYPPNGMSKIDTIRKILPGVFRPIIDYAKGKGINIALENYFRTCLQGVDTFECLFETIPDANFGLNYDPSHLYHQQCDHLQPVSMFKDRIFHTHAKDTLVDVAARTHVGVLGDGWWRYVVPGSGDIAWGKYINCLRANGYAGVLSIENEDGAVPREKGFMLAARHLEQFC